jgi:hypothetical protein
MRHAGVCVRGAGDTAQALGGMRDAASSGMKLILFVAFLAAIPALADRLPSTPREAGIDIATASLQPHTGAPAPLTDGEREWLCGG